MDEPMSLTPRQKDCLDFIVSYTKDRGYSPNYREIAEGIGVKAISNVHYYVERLKVRGYVKTVYGSERSIEVLKTSAI
tara:strand:- start:297 stop:530 length:234 start_codon:yes stop_codon:yes gene_type:complete